MTLIESLIVVAVLGVLASMAVLTGGTDRDQLQLAAAARRLEVGLNRARSIARREQRPCGVALNEEGLSRPGHSQLPGDLSACSHVEMSLQEDLEQGPIQLYTNFPAVLRYAANGLLLDGGMAVLTHQRLSTARCLVVSLPLGVIRIGSYQDPLPLTGKRLLSSRCLPDDLPG